MSFADAMLALKQGKKIRLPWWGGYWYLKDGRLRIHCYDGKDFDAFSTANGDPLQTLSYCGASCWEVV